jgi:hypothetical protein
VDITTGGSDERVVTAEPSSPRSIRRPDRIGSLMEGDALMEAVEL